MKGKYLIQLINPFVKTFNRDYNRIERRNHPELYMSPMIRFVKNLNNNNPHVVGVEIGVASGVNAENILLNLSMDRLFLVDPYVKYVEDNIGIVDHHSNQMVYALNRLSRFKDKIVFVKDFSDKAVVVVPDDVDFVYIDGNHSYDFVKKDIELYYPKIKTGGVIGGHDFNSNSLGVVKAVIEFAKKHDLKIYGNSTDIDWWVVKK